MLGITAQLVAIDSNRRLSRIVRNLTELLYRGNLTNGDGYDEHGNVTPVMVIIAMLHSIHHMFGTG